MFKFLKFKHLIVIKVDLVFLTKIVLVDYLVELKKSYVQNMMLDVEIISFINLIDMFQHYDIVVDIKDIIEIFIQKILENNFVSEENVEIYKIVEDEKDQKTNMHSFY